MLEEAPTGNCGGLVFFWDFITMPTIGTPIAIISAALLVLTGAISIAVALFRAGHRWAKIEKHFEILNVGLQVINNHLGRHDDSMQDLYQKWDRMIQDIVTKKDCETLRSMLSRDAAARKKK